MSRHDIILNYPRKYKISPHIRWWRLYQRIREILHKGKTRAFICHRSAKWFKNYWNWLWLFNCGNLL